VIVYGSFFAINCKTADTITGKCQKCDSGHGLSNDIPGTCELCSAITGGGAMIVIVRMKMS
jgi:hypothetical protein